MPNFEQIDQMPQGFEIPQVDIPDEIAPSRRPEVEITTPHTTPGPGPGAQAIHDTFMNPIGFIFPHNE